MHTCVHANFCAVGFYSMFLGLHLLVFRTSTFKPIQDLTQTRVCRCQGGGKTKAGTACSWLLNIMYCASVKWWQHADNCSVSCSVPILCCDSV